jgi:hypothetical protein
VLAAALIPLGFGLISRSQSRSKRPMTLPPGRFDP